MADLVADLIRTGALVTGALGWLWFVYRWSDALTPRGPVTRASRIYFEIEDQFFQRMIQRIISVLDANERSLMMYAQNRLAVQYALRGELEGILQTLNFGRGQRDEVVRHGRQRCSALVAIWFLAFSVVLFVLNSISVTRSTNGVSVIVSRPLCLWIAVGLFAVNVGCMFFVRQKQVPLEDGLGALEAIRDALRD